MVLFKNQNGIIHMNNNMNEKKILLSHGSGGVLTHKLIKLLIKAFNNPILDKLNDSAIFTIDKQKLAFTTDSYVVDPIFFPGGDIGKLAINGTVNDLSMSGAIPLYISLGFILEEGFSISDFKKIIKSIQTSANIAQVEIVTGDTKVVPKGKGDKIYINTSGIGIINHDLDIGGDKARVGDVIIINGSIGDHGITIMSKREGLEFSSNLKSDTAPLNKLVQEMLETSKNIHVLRDPTRGGVATTLNEISSQS